MFTGIIEELGIVEKKESTGGGFRFRIRAPQSARELRIHDSVSINGACHTVVQRDGQSFEVESVEETLKKTSLRLLDAGSAVNLELPLRLNERLGGHLVLGHVDATGSVQSIEPRGSSWIFRILIPQEFQRYVIPVGSIAIDGVSLTIAGIQGPVIMVSIIPHTMDNTIFRSFRPGTVVNLEFDMVGKYIERMLAGTPSGGKIVLKEGNLREMGY